MVSVEQRTYLTDSSHSQLYSQLNIQVEQMKQPRLLRRNLTYIMMVMTLMAGVSGLSTHGDLPAFHAQSQSQNQYLQQLISTEKNLHTQIQQLKSLSQTINNNVTEYQRFPSVQTDTLLNGITQQRQLLLQASKQLNLPPTNHSCQNITESQAIQIRSQITNTQNNLMKLENKISQQSQECVLTNQISSQITYLHNYINSLSLQLNNRCEQQNNATEPQIVYTLNPAATNFTYGKNASYEQTYLNRIQALVQDGHIQKQCPEKKPFPHGDNLSNCVSCSENSHYDFSKQMCLSCPPRYQFNVQNHRCYIRQFNSNAAKANNYYGSLPVYDPGLESCPSDKPYFNNQQCVSCVLPGYFNFKTLTCQQCASGLEFSTATKTCGYQQWNTNPYASKNTCCGEVTVNPALRTCPEFTPFFDGRKCINCLQPTYFSLQNLQCTSCPSGQGFSVIQAQCVDQKYLQQVYLSFLTPNIQNYIGKPPQLSQDYENVQKCTQSHPYSNGKLCIACSLPSYFNFNNLQCQICQPDSQFSITQHQCVQKQTTIYNTNLAALDNFMGKIPSYASEYATCPSSKPYFDGSDCMSCELPKFINFDTNSCEECEEGSSFSIFNRQCEVTQELFYTDLNSPNIYYNGDFNEFVDRLEKKKLVNPSLRKCRKEHPYYNAIKGICQSCPSKYPLYDIKFNRCISCTGESSYFPSRRLCLAKGFPTATVERMMMNTVGFL